STNGDHPCSTAPRKAGASVTAAPARAVTPAIAHTTRSRTNLVVLPSRTNARPPLLGAPHDLRAAEGWGRPEEVLQPTTTSRSATAPGIGVHSSRRSSGSNA